MAFNAETAQNVEVSVKLPPELAPMEQLRLMERYTETHKAASALSKEEREVACLRVLYPALLRSIEPQDLIAGRLDFLPIGFGCVTSVGGVGHYCVFHKLTKFKEQLPQSEHPRVDALYAYWLDHDLKTKYCKDALKDDIVGMFIDCDYPLIATARLSGMMLDYRTLMKLGIGGLQGQGQSEFIRAILGAETIEAGSIQYCGKTAKFKSPAEAVKNGLGFISGERNREAMFPLRSIEENILAGKVAKGPLFAYMYPKANHRFANEAVEKYAIKIGELHNPASSLSGGNQQKLVVARWIAMNPTLLLLDDPTKGVDIHSRQEIHKILRKCAEEGMTVIISSSETEELLAISDRIYVFYEGCVSAMLSGGNKTPERLVAAMMGMTGAASNETDGKETVQQ